MPTRYHPLLVALHWLMALMITVALIMGSQFLAEMPNDDPEKIFALRGHMGVGIALLVLVLVRLVLRLATAKPAHADIGNETLNKGAIAAHWAFYAVIIAMCASGIAMARMAGLPEIVFFGSGDPLPESFYDYPPRYAHGILATLLAALIVGHVAAGLYHQIVRKDRLFSRMWFGNRQS